MRKIVKVVGVVEVSKLKTKLTLTASWTFLIDTILKAKNPQAQFTQPPPPPKNPLKSLQPPSAPPVAFKNRAKGLH